jgi:hypothetical protein
MDIVSALSDSKAGMKKVELLLHQNNNIDLSNDNILANE